MGEVTAYLDGLDDDRAGALRRIVAIARDLAPDAVEGTSYGMPTLKVRGKALLSVMATRKHLALYPHSGSIVAAVADRLPGFSLSSGTIRFQTDQPLPEDVVRDVIRLRLDQIPG
jgi:uncharacterized protein YdhG (YjbR/CyaY superfamily)